MERQSLYKLHQQQDQTQDKIQDQIQELIAKERELLVKERKLLIELNKLRNMFYSLQSEHEYICLNIFALTLIEGTMKGLNFILRAIFMLCTK